jgi:hypothetical protein
MAAPIVNSPRAIEMSVYVVRAFVQAARTARLEQGAGPPLRAARSPLDHKLTEHHEAIAAVLEAARQRIHAPAPKPPADRFHGRYRYQEVARSRRGTPR